jgi:general secretion pathway protein K
LWIDLSVVLLRMEQERNQGFALIAVIWISGLLAVLATSFVLEARTEGLIAGNRRDVQRLESIADGVALVRAEQIASMPPNELMKVANGSPSACVWSHGVTVMISIQDQGGLIDINMASPDLVAAVVKRLGATDVQARKILGESLDFRDADGVAFDGSAEPLRYTAQTIGPKNAPYESIEEIAQLPSMTDDLRSRLLPLLTVFSQQLGIDPATAPPRLMALLGEKDQSQSTIQSFASPSALKVFAIDVSASSATGSVFARRLIASVLRQPDRPFAILSWERGYLAQTSPPAQAPSCFN